jgi:hypothetical protein
LNRESRRIWVALLNLGIAFAFIVALSNLFPAYLLALPAPFQVVLFLGLVIAIYPLVHAIRNATWKRFKTMPVISGRVWVGITLVISIGCIFTPFGSLFPQWTPRLIPTAIPQVGSTTLDLVFCMLFFVYGVWLTTLFNSLSHLGSHLGTLSRKINPFHVGLLAGIYILFSLIVTGPGLLHPEMYVRLPAHISGKPIMQIIFNAQTMNNGGWEARQLSFLFDMIDGNFVAWCIRLGIPNFRSITQFVFSLIIVGYLWVSFTRDMKMDRLISLFMISFLLTTPSFVYNDYYRTSKIGVTLMMVILLAELYKVLTRNAHPEVKLWKPLLLLLLFFLTALALTLFDFLGVLMAGVLTGYCFIIFVFKPDKYKAAVTGGLVLALIAWAFYFFSLGPVLTLTFSGVPIDSSFITQANMVNLLPYLKREIPLLLVDMVRTLFGFGTQLQGFFIILFFCILALWLGVSPRKTGGEKLLSGNTGSEMNVHDQSIQAGGRFGAVVRAEPFFTLLVLFGGILVVYDFLITRWPPILWQDVRFTYYIMPAQAILLFGLVTFLARPPLQKKMIDPNLYPVVILLLIFFLGGNIVGVIHIKSILEGGSLAASYQYAPLLLDALKNLNSNNFLPAKTVLADPIYQLFLSLISHH